MASRSHDARLVITRVRLPRRWPVERPTRMWSEVTDGFGRTFHHAGMRTVTARQQAVPEALQGRVSSGNSLGVYGGLVVGA